jgi:lipoprotein-anchoring transpeptidase ErfK/SrfK
LYFDGSIGLHGTFWHNGFGYRHSRGCVNLSISDAKWLYNFADVGTPVYVWRSR